MNKLNTIKLPKLIATDIDGCWTDGSMYISEKGDETKRFNTYDSKGVLFAKMNNIIVCIITGENTKIVEKRSEKLKIDYLFQGVNKKINIIENLCEKLKIDIKDVAYFGDDINDYEVILKVGISGCPFNAESIIKNNVDIITQKKGGDGAFYEFVQKILKKCNIYEQTLMRAINSKN